MKHALVALLLFSALDLRADVTGALVTAEGKPVEGARIELFAKQAWSHQLANLQTGIADSPLATAESDAKGDFKLAVAKRGNYDVRVTRDGFAPAAVATTGTEDLGGILMRPAAMKRGRVTANGKPVANARLLFLRDGAEFSVVTDEAGAYSVPDPAAWRPSVHLFHPDSAPHFEAKPPNASGTVALDITLRDGATLRGKVLDPSGKSGAKAKLWIDGVAAGESNGDGAFELRHLSPISKEIVAVSGSLVARGSPANAKVLRLAKALTFSGTVLDANTRLPIAGASVVLRADRFGETLITDGLTDAKGNFLFATILPGSYELHVQHAGYGFSRTTETLSESTSRKPLHLQPQGRFVGHVLDDARRPVAAARTAVRIRSNNVFFIDDSNLVSAPDGRYALAVDPRRLEHGELDVEARARGYATAKDGPHAIRAGEEKRVDLVLSRGNTLSGRVIDGDEDPIRGVTVAAVEIVGTRTFSQPYGVKWDEEPKTDADGAFELHLRPGTYDLYFHALGYAPRKLPAVDVQKPVEPLEIVLEPAASISGRVVTSDGEPVADLDLEASIDGPAVLATTDQSGAFALHGLPKGSVMVSIDSGDGAIAEFRDINAPAENVTIELTPSVRVSGRVVTKDGRAVTDFATEIAMRSNGNYYYGGGERRNRFHDAEGRFVIEKVAVRPSELIVTAPGFARSRIAIELEKGKNLDDLEVKLDRAGTVIGRVTGPNGTAVEGVRVFVQSDEPGVLYRDPSTTDANGEYRLEAIPLGETTINYQKKGFQPLKKPVNVDSGEVRADARLETGKVLAGRVVTESGTPVAEADVRAWSMAAGAVGANAKTDASGRFSLEGLGSGIYEVRAVRRGYMEARLPDVDIDRAGELTVTLRSGATITGRILGLDVSREEKPLRVSAAGDGVQTNGTVDPNGTYRIEGAPVGKIGIRAFTTGATRRSTELAEIETDNGGSYTVDLEFKEHNTIRGRITLDGAPMRGGNISVLRRGGPRVSAGATIADDGGYELQGIPTGQYNVMIFNPIAGVEYMTVRDFTRSETVDIDMRPSSLTARVFDDATGEPLAGAELSLQPAEAGQTPNRPGARSGSDGRVVLENISPGDYDMRVVREGYASQLARRTFAEGSAVQFDVRLTPSEGLALTVIDGRNGKPVHAQITARNASGTIVYSDYNSKMRADGTMVVPLAPGNYRLNIFSRGLGAIFADVTSPGSHRVTMRQGGILEFETSGPVSARVLSADGSIYNVYPGQTETSRIVLDGTQYTDMAAGIYTVQRLDANASVTQSERVEIREGQTTKVSLR